MSIQDIKKFQLNMAFQYDRDIFGQGHVMIIGTFLLLFSPVFSRAILFETKFGLQIEGRKLDQSDRLQELDLRKI